MKVSSPSFVDSALYQEVNFSFHRNASHGDRQPSTDLAKNSLLRQWQDRKVTLTDFKLNVTLAVRLA